jgi:hypothetical protein
VSGLLCKDVCNIAHQISYKMLHLFYKPILAAGAFSFGDWNERSEEVQRVSAVPHIPRECQSRADHVKK